MAQFEVYRYFWIKVTDPAGRAAAAAAALKLSQTLATESESSASHVQYGADAHTERDMVRWYMGGDVMKVIKIVVVSPFGNSVTTEVLLTHLHSASDDGIDLEIATMPAGYTKQLSAEWIDTRIGKVWSTGAIACKLGHSVATPGATAALPGNSSDDTIFV